MRSDRDKADILTSREHHRATHAEGIGCTAGGRIDDQSIGLVGREVLVAKVHTDANHAAAVVLEHSDLVEGKGIALHLTFGALHL